jgi:hypothetical protein
MKSLKEFQVQIDEVLTKKTPLSKWVHDFVHSDNPKFAGKSKDERIKMAQGAYYGAQKESVEEGENKQMKGKDPCWKGYQMVGMKKKGDRKVPNCVPVKEDISIDEGKMAELHASLSQHLDKHVAEYKRVGGAESLGHKSTVAAGKISKEHGIAAHHAQKFVNDYIENKLKESMKEDIKAEHVREAVEYKGIGTDVVDKKKKLNPQPNLTTAKKTVKDFKEEKDEREYGYEGDMAITQLKTIMRHADHLMGMLKPETDLPEWVQSKITLATDYMQTAHDYLMSEMNEEAELEESRGHKVIATFLKNREVAKRAYQGNPAKDAEVAQGGGSPADQGIAAAKKDYKKLNKEGVSMLNFNDFLKEAKCGSMKKEELKGNQHKLDHNKNGKLDADDFKKLRGEEKDLEVAKRAYQGNPAKDAEVAQGGGSPADQGIAAAKKDYKKLNKEGFVSHAQRKAVWASKNEKGVKEEVKDKKDSPPFDPDPKPAKKVTPGKYGQGYSQAKHLAQKGMKSLTKEDLDQFTLEEIEEFMTTESYEQLDEISKETLASYIPKAAKSSRIHGMISTDYKNSSQRKKNPGLKNALDSLSQKYKSKAWSREKSIAKAVGKLTKEDVEINEGKMKDIYTGMMAHATKKGYKSHKQFTSADYDTVAKQHGISGKELAVIAGHKTTQKVAKEDVDFEQTKKVSYNQFIKSIEEGKIDDYLDKKRADANTASAYSDKKKSSTKQPSVTINKGRAYGGSNQKDDEGDDKPETTEKRGRGRPTGSKSGARQKGNGHNDGGIPVHNLNLPTRNNKF